MVSHHCASSVSMVCIFLLSANRALFGPLRGKSGDRRVGGSRYISLRACNTASRRSKVSFSHTRGSARLPAGQLRSARLSHASASLEAEKSPQHLGVG